MVFLQTHSVSMTYAGRIYKQYRERAIAVVRENPQSTGRRHRGHRLQERLRRKSAHCEGRCACPPSRARGLRMTLGPFGWVTIPPPSASASATAVDQLNSRKWVSKKAPLKNGTSRLLCRGVACAVHCVTAVIAPGAKEGPHAKKLRLEACKQASAVDARLSALTALRVLHAGRAFGL